DPADLSMTLAVNNVLLPQYPPGSAGITIGIQSLTSGITHAGTYPVTAFSWGGSMLSYSTVWFLSNAGIGSGVIDVLPYPGVPNTFYVDQANITFGGLPEPSPASLLLIGLAGFAVLGRRRRARRTLLAAG